MTNPNLQEQARAWPNIKRYSGYPSDPEFIRILASRIDDLEGALKDIEIAYYEEGKPAKYRAAKMRGIATSALDGALSEDDK